jgi:hypothetical protein
MDADSKTAETPETPAADAPQGGASAPAGDAKTAEDDPMKALQDSLDNDSKKK